MATVAAAGVVLEVEFAGDNPAGGTSEDVSIYYIPSAVATVREQHIRSTRSTHCPAAEFDDGYVDHGSDGSSWASLANAPSTSSDVGIDAEGKLEEEQDGEPYALCRRTKINYAVPPPLGELKPPPPLRNSNVGGKRRGSEWNASGAKLSG
ncbi:hypothetical protein EDC04DRAFT_2910693 [Pisolithus marmoratus]|nr:hypothetical protein EDC04DRAFT_2910693 [Pisolithus marmoratus]